MLAVAGIAAYVSHRHACAVVRVHSETGITARLEPTTIDGLVHGYPPRNLRSTWACEVMPLRTRIFTLLLSPFLIPLVNFVLRAT